MPLGSNYSSVSHSYMFHHGNFGLNYLVLATGHYRRQHQLHYAHQLDCPHSLQLLQCYVYGAWIHSTRLETSTYQPCAGLLAVTFGFKFINALVLMSQNRRISVMPSTCSTAECAKVTKPPDLITVASVTGSLTNYQWSKILSYITLVCIVIAVVFTIMRNILPYWPRPPRCVMKMDHHCPWINNCCGHVNHAYFTSFLLLAPLGCSHAAIIFIMTMYTQLYERVSLKRGHLYGTLGGILFD